MPMPFNIEGVRTAETLYGENPHQKSFGLFADTESTDPLAVHNFKHTMGNEPSFNNYAAISNMLQTITHIAAGLEKNGHQIPNIAVAFKHRDACGVSINDDTLAAVKQATIGNPIAIHGGTTMFNFKLTAEHADLLLHHNLDTGAERRLIDVVTAPDIDDDVADMLVRKKSGKLRILTNKALGSLSLSSLDQSSYIRPVRGGFLAQENFVFVPDMHSDIWLEDNGEADPQLEQMLILAWAIGSTASSNTITLVKDGMLIGNGAGEQDRVAAAELAVRKARRAGHDTTGAVAYSDSFFPFPDGPQVLVDAGISAVFTSSGSLKNDETVFKTFKNGGARVFHAPDKEIRGFYGH
jgi:phosphoribosylaminoimidazolecarboxamide formyltransferase/IMP cyclohydrolase